MTRSTPLIGSVDALEIPVPELEAGLAFYRDRLGHTLIWRTATAAGLRMAGGDTELVLLDMSKGPLQVDESGNVVGTG